MPSEDEKNLALLVYSTLSSQQKDEILLAICDQQPGMFAKWVRFVKATREEKVVGVGLSKAKETKETNKETKEMKEDEVVGKKQVGQKRVALEVGAGPSKKARTGELMSLPPGEDKLTR
jgi:hypothetical protein